MLQLYIMTLSRHEDKIFTKPTSIVTSGSDFFSFPGTLSERGNNRTIEDFPFGNTKSLHYHAQLSITGFTVGNMKTVFSVFLVQFLICSGVGGGGVPDPVPLAMVASPVRDYRIGFMHVTYTL